MGLLIWTCINLLKAKTSRIWKRIDVVQWIHHTRSAPKLLYTRSRLPPRVSPLMALAHHRHFIQHKILVSRRCSTLLKETLFLITQHVLCHIQNAAHSPDIYSSSTEPIRTRLGKILIPVTFSIQHMADNLTQLVRSASATFEKSWVNMLCKLLVDYSSSTWYIHYVHPWSFYMLNFALMIKYSM